MPIVHGEENRENHILTWDKIQVRGGTYVDGKNIKSINLKVEVGDVAQLEVTCYGEYVGGSEYPMVCYTFPVTSIDIRTLHSPYNGGEILNSKEIEMEFLE